MKNNFIIKCITTSVIIFFILSVSGHAETPNEELMPEVLFGAGAINGPRLFLKLNIETANITKFTRFGFLGVEGMAFNSEGVLYGVIPKDELVVVGPGGSRTTPIGSIGNRNIQALAIDLKGNIFGVDIDAAELVSINKNNAEVTAIGSLGIDKVRVEGLAYDYWKNRLIAAAGNRIISINPKTGKGKIIGKLRSSAINGLSFNGDGQLYGVHANAHQLVIIDLDTFKEFVVGNTGRYTVVSIAFTNQVKRNIITRTLNGFIKGKN